MIVLYCDFAPELWPEKAYKAICGKYVPDLGALTQGCSDCVWFVPGTMED